MNVPFVAFLALLGACASPPPREPLPMTNGYPGHRNEIVAFLNGEPISWQAVAEKALELNLKDAVDQYVRWKIVEERRTALGISHTPEELHRRAGIFLALQKNLLKEEQVRGQLDREGITENGYLQRLASSSFLAQLLTFDKILRYDALLEDQWEIDRMSFVDEAEARRFAERAREAGFEKAADESTAGERREGIRRFPRETLLKSQPPEGLASDPWIVEQICKLKTGEWTGVETSRMDLLCVIRVTAFRPATTAPYADIRSEVLESILKDPPAGNDYALWMNRQMEKRRIEYGSRP
jgi:hypothetical protein